MKRESGGIHPNARWYAEHDPLARPLGCNGKYGGSGDQAHRRRGEPVCEACRVSCNHLQRERTRGQGNPRPPVSKCGTPTGARDHYRRKEKLCLPCRLAQAAAAAERVARRKADKLSSQTAAL